MFISYSFMMFLTVMVSVGIGLFSLFVTHVLDKPATNSWVVDIFDH